MNGKYDHTFNYKDHWDPGLFTSYDMLQHVTHNCIINFVKGIFPLASEAHCGCTSLHEYVNTIKNNLLFVDSVWLASVAEFTINRLNSSA